MLLRPQLYLVMLGQRFRRREDPHVAKPFSRSWADPLADLQLNGNLAGPERECASVFAGFDLGGDLDRQPDRQDISKRAEPIAIPDWALRTVKPEGGITGVLHPSRAIEEPQELGATAQKGQDKAIQKGNLTHKLLEVLPGLARKGREAPARAYLATPAFSLSKPEQQRLWASVSRVLDNPAFADIFGPGSRAEVSLVGVIDGKFISAQIDRLIVKADEVLIVDYKSNRDVPENPANVPPGYLAQLGLYAKLVKQVYGGRKVRTALLWTEDCSLMEIPAKIIKS